MPPKARTNSKHSVEQEGRVLLAVSALKKKEILNIREAVRVYNVPYTTLQRRLKGHTVRAEIRANGYKMTQNEEESLIRWILSMDQRGAAPRPSHVREMANILLAQRGSIPTQTVGEKWVYNFINRHDVRSLFYKQAKPISLTQPVLFSPSRFDSAGFPAPGRL
jgi:hypothetical protein